MQVHLLNLQLKLVYQGQGH